MKIFSPILKGTTTVAQGTTNLSGSFTGSLLGTAATASYADNFTVGGTLTAQTINVQIITSSIEFNTGSTRNGSSTANTHQFTGSVLVSGSLTVGGPALPMVIASTNSTELYTEYRYNTSTVVGYIGNGTGVVSAASASDFGVRAQNNLIFAAGGNNERMRITSAGNVGIGNTGFANTRVTITGISTTSSNFGLVVNNSSNSNLFLVRDDGLVTIPSQPSFYVTSNAALTDYTTDEVIVFNTARHNTGNHYNTSTGRFTAPVAGKYLFTLNVYAYPSYTAAILLYINGAQHFGGADVSPYIYTGAAATAKTISFTLIWELSASDYIEVRARSTTRIYRGHSHFSGQLLS